MFDKIEWQRNQRKSDNNVYTRRYEKTKKGFLVRCYRNMLSRVSGICHKRHLYEGKSILIKELFYSWSLNDNTFNSLFEEWELNNYKRKICPSIDRINSDLGYEIGNIRWITLSDNSKNTKRNNGKK